MFIKAIAQLSPEKKNIIRTIGFGSILDFKCSSNINQIFVWLINQIDTNSATITLENGFSFSLSPMFVSKILGIPFGSKPVEMTHSNEASHFIHKIVHDEVPTVEHLCLLITTEMDEQTFICIFMLLLLAAFIAPNGDGVASASYFSNLLDTTAIPQLDWCTFTLDWLMLQIKKYLHRKMQGIESEIGGCKLILVV